LSTHVCSVCCSCLGCDCRDLRRYRRTNQHVLHGTQSLLVRCSLYAVGERSLFHTLRNAPSVIGRAPTRRKTTSPTMRSHSSLW
jgi:hypothetical protein